MLWVIQLPESKLAALTISFKTLFASFCYLGVPEPLVVVGEPKELD